MTDPTHDPALPEPVASPVQPPVEREHIPPAAGPKRDLLPIIYLVGFVVLAGALAYLWQNPPVPDVVAADTTRLTALQGQIEALGGRVAQVEQRPAPAAPPPVDLGPLDKRIAALEARPVPEPPKPGPAMATAADLAAATTRLDALTQQQQELAARATSARDELTKQLAAERDGIAKQLAGERDGLAKQLAAERADLTKQLAAERAELVKRLDALEARIAAAEQQASQVAGLAQRSELTAQVQAATAALSAGRPIGKLPGAPPALARFADAAPPTEAQLRLDFPKAAAAAEHASQPALTDNQPLLNRMWFRAQQTVSVRQGDRVLLGDPIGGVLAKAQQLLDAGDLAGAVKALDGLAGPAKAAMADWTGQAQALLDARSAMATLGAQR